MMDLNKLEEMLAAAKIALPVCSDVTCSQIRSPDDAFILYDEGGATEEASAYVVALLNTAPELIDLARKQEAALTGVQSRMGGLLLEKAGAAPLLTVDSTAFQLRLANIRASGDPDVFIKELVEWLDAHTARVVAAARQEGWDSCALANQELVRQLRDQIAAQPVAVELPPLPEPHPTHYRERSLTLERLEMYTDEQMREYGRLCRAGQPVQQPAAK